MTDKLDIKKAEELFTELCAIAIDIQSSLNMSPICDAEIVFYCEGGESFAYTWTVPETERQCAM